MKILNLCFIVVFLTACGGRMATEKAATPAASSNVSTCIGCHGGDGMSGKQDVPPIGHLSADEMMGRINEIKENNPGVPLLAHSLTREDIAEIANYFAKVNGE